MTAASAAPGHPARAVLGSRRSAYWLSARLGRHARLAQSITIRLPSAELVSGLTYVPRRPLGEIGRFRVTLSRDGRRFGRTVAYGRWQANATDKKVAWMPRVVRAVRLTVLSVSPVGAPSVAAARIVLTGARLHRPAAGAEAASCRQRSRRSVGRRPVGANDRLPARPSGRGADPGQQARGVVGGRRPELRLEYIAVHADSDPGSHDGRGQRCDDQQHGPQHVLPGVSILPDGEVMVTGGISDTLTSIYNPTTNTWRAGPQMNIGRGYQGQTTLSDGQVFVPRRLVVGRNWRQAGRGLVLPPVPGAS